jgi:hypothetical protein
MSELANPLKSGFISPTGDLKVAIDFSERGITTGKVKCSPSPRARASTWVLIVLFWPQLEARIIRLTNRAFVFIP